MATQAPALHIGAAESMQSADAEHVDTTAAVASMVLPAKVTVKDIAAGSTAGAVDTHVPLKFPLETGTARGMLIPMPRSKGRHNSKMVCDSLPNWVKNQGGGTPLGNTSTRPRSTMMVISPYRYNSHFSLRHLSDNLIVVVVVVVVRT